MSEERSQRFERAKEIVIRMGIKFGVEEIAEEAAGDFRHFVRRGDDPVIVAWKVFLGALENYDLMEKAFTNGLHRDGFVPFFFSRLRIMDAEDVSQVALLSAWNSFESFIPESTSSWEHWLLMIANRKFNTFMAEHYREREHIEWMGRDSVFALDSEVEDDVETTPSRRHIAVRTVAERWINGRHPKKALFAAKILAMLDNEEEYIGLMGKYMEEYVGVSRQGLSNWTREFIREVEDES